MRIGKVEIKRRVWVGLGSGLVATAAWWGWTKNHSTSPASPPAAAPPFVRLVTTGGASSDQILSERADLFDPTPLFFPTEWNFGQQPLPDRLRPKPDEVFPSFPAKLAVRPQNMKSYGVESSAIPKDLVDLLLPGNEAPFAGARVVDLQPSPLPERAGFLEIRSFNGSKVVMYRVLMGISVPRPDFAPMEFVVTVSSTGLVGDPLIAASSGWDEVDVFFRTYLVKTFRVGQRLAPGSYRVVIGP